LTRLEKEEATRLLELENELHKRVVSQDEAIQGHQQDDPPGSLGSERSAPPDGFVPVLGPSGVGKTLLSKALAEFMFAIPMRSCKST